MDIIHFCGGLPRSGSSILMNILQQNPRIFTTGTCAFQDLLKTKILIESRISEPFIAMSVEQADRAMFGLIQGATKGWFEGLTNKPVVISKRHGCSGLMHLYKRSKFICMIRDIRDVVESFVKLNNNTLALHTFNNNGVLIPSMHWREKFNYFFNEGNSVSFAINHEIPRFMESFKEKNVLFLRYEDFTLDPNYMLKKVYNFLEEEYFEHDLNNIDQSELFEHDLCYYRERTDHYTNSKFIKYKLPNRTLCKEFHDRVISEHVWFYESFYPEVVKNER